MQAGRHCRGWQSSGRRCEPKGAVRTDDTRPAERVRCSLKHKSGGWGVPGRATGAGQDTSNEDKEDNGHSGRVAEEGEGVGTIWRRLQGVDDQMRRGNVGIDAE